MGGTDAAPWSDCVRDLVAALRLRGIWWRLGVQDLRLRFRRAALGIGCFKTLPQPFVQFRIVSLPKFLARLDLRKIERLAYR